MTKNSLASNYISQVTRAKLPTTLTAMPEIEAWGLK